MESIADRPALLHLPHLPRRIDVSALSVWVLVAGSFLYPALNGGGFDPIVHSQIGIVVWWMVLIGAIFGLLPVAQLSRRAWAALGLFGGFVGWTALASTWSLSSERSLADLALVAGYLGVLLLGIMLHRDRERAIRHTVSALATAVVIVAGLALASRLRPDLFPAAQQTAFFLPAAQGRLNWPLNYWNALAALTALGLPLLLAVATSSRALAARAAAAAGIPIVALCGYLTFSRGGAVAVAVGLVVFFLLAPDRIPKLATAAVAAAGSAVVIAGAVHRSAIERGLPGTAAQHQGSALLVVLVLVCGGVALAQVGVALAVRHGTPPRWMMVSRQRALILSVQAIVVCVIVALVLGAPTRLSHAWTNFKNPTASALHQNSLSRFGTVSGNGRYDYWKASLDATSGHVLGGNGPGTFQLLWLPRAPYYSYVQNAHSLYFETLAELGVVGLGLLVGFFVLVLGAAVRLVARSSHETRARTAGVAGALFAFSASAASDWVWQVPALPTAFLLLAAAVVAPDPRAVARSWRPTAGAPHSAGGRRLIIRFGASAVAVAALLGIALPLATTTAERQSQAAATAGNATLALRDARAAARLEPGGASAQLQLALVLELQRDIPKALVAAHRATGDEPANWSVWMVDSRLEAEAGHAAASLRAFSRARSLNPTSPLFVVR